jgi:hypothetical protein
MVSRSMHGTSFLPGFQIMNRTAPLRKITRSPEKPSAGSSRQPNRQAENRAEQEVESFAAGAPYHGIRQRGVYAPVALDQPVRQFHSSHRCVAGWKLNTGFLIPLEKETQHLEQSPTCAMPTSLEPTSTKPTSALQPHFPFAAIESKRFYLSSPCFKQSVEVPHLLIGEVHRDPNHAFLPARRNRASSQHRS